MDPSRLLPLAMLAFASSGALADSIAVVPANPTPVDVVRLRYQHTGCINPDSLRITQESNRIVVSADRSFIADECGSIAGFFEDLTIGRFPSGEYDAQLVVNPPPGTLGPSFLVGPIHFTVASMPPTGSLLPHEDYSDLWWNPAESGWALHIERPARIGAGRSIPKRSPSPPRARRTSRPRSRAGSYSPTPSTA